MLQRLGVCEQGASPECARGIRVSLFNAYIDVRGLSISGD